MNTVTIIDESNTRLGYKIINPDELKEGDQIIPVDEFEEMMAEKKKEEELKADPIKAQINSLEAEIAKLKKENSALKKELSAPKKTAKAKK